jgi:hypothetical protein
MDKYQQAHQDWIECLCRIGRKETELFEEDNMKYLDTLTWSGLRRGIMVWVYNDLSRDKKLTRIEDLDQDTKKQMWNTVREMCAGKTDDKKIMIEIAKSFYLIEYFLNKRTCP